MLHMFMFQYVSLHPKPAWTVLISFRRGLQDQMCWDVLVRPDTPSLPNSSDVCHVPRVASLKSSMFAWVKVLARSGPAWNSMLPQHATDWDAADSQAEIRYCNLSGDNHGKTGKLEGAWLSLPLISLQGQDPSGRMDPRIQDDSMTERIWS